MSSETHDSPVLVVDASVVVKWFLDEPGSKQARSLAGQPLAAPSLLLTECANIFWRKVRTQELTGDEALDNMRLLGEAPISIQPQSLDLDLAALELAVALGHPVYDCLYLALTMRMNARLVTADRRFQRVIESNSALSELLLEFEP